MPKEVATEFRRVLQMNNLPRNVTRMRTAAFFHLKSAAALIESDDVSDSEIAQALALLGNAEDKLEMFEDARQQYFGANPITPEMI